MNNSLIKYAIGFMAIMFGIYTAVHAETVVVDYGLRYQTLRGMGTSGVVAEANQDYYMDVLGASSFRQWLSPSLIAATTLDQILWENFDTESAAAFMDRSYELKKNYPNLFLIGTFWTPPGWMKVSGSEIGGSLRNDREAYYARYVLEYAKMMRDYFNAPLDAISFANEPKFEEPYVSCVYSDDQYARVFKLIVDEFRQADFPMKFFGPEHMTNDWTVNNKMLSGILTDPNYADAFTAVATHGYTDGIASDSNPASANNIYVKVADPFIKEFWMTETSGETMNWDGALNGVASKMHNAFVGGNCSLYSYWQISNNSSAEALMLANMMPTKKTYAFQHFSKYIRPGMIRVDATPDTSDKVDVSAWVDFQNNALVMVILNRDTKERVVPIQLLHATGITALNLWRTSTSDSENFKQLSDVDVSDTGEATVTLPAQSMITLRGTNGNFPLPEITVSPTDVTVPSSAASYDFTVTSTLPEFRWMARSRNFFAKVSSDADNYGNGTVTITTQRNATSTSRTTTLLIGGQTINFTQMASGPTSIFAADTDSDLKWGFRWNKLGYFYDLYYPFVYLWSVKDWIYIAYEGAAENTGFFFYRFDQSEWGWTSSEYYPNYYSWAGDGGWVDLNE